MNASNDIAVEGFLDGKISFMQIPDIIKAQLDSFSGKFGTSLDDILEVDKIVRDNTRKFI
jgi:1-deoxy-D-xylulose-5-phosphate reductoisomerase